MQDHHRLRETQACHPALSGSPEGSSSGCSQPGPASQRLPYYKLQRPTQPWAATGYGSFASQPPRDLTTEGSEACRRSSNESSSESDFRFTGAPRPYQLSAPRVLSAEDEAGFFVGSSSRQHTQDSQPVHRWPALSTSASYRLLPHWPEYTTAGRRSGSAQDLRAEAGAGCSQPATPDWLLPAHQHPLWGYDSPQAAPQLQQGPYADWPWSSGASAAYIASAYRHWLGSPSVMHPANGLGAQLHNARQQAAGIGVGGDRASSTQAAEAPRGFRVAIPFSARVAALTRAADMASRAPGSQGALFERLREPIPVPGLGLDTSWAGQDQWSPAGSTSWQSGTGESQVLPSSNQADAALLSSHLLRACGPSSSWPTPAAATSLSGDQAISMDPLPLFAAPPDYTSDSVETGVLPRLVSRLSEVQLADVPDMIDCERMSPHCGQLPPVLRFGTPPPRLPSPPTYLGTASQDMACGALLPSFIPGMEQHAPLRELPQRSAASNSSQHSPSPKSQKLSREGTPWCGCQVLGVAQSSSSSPVGPAGSLDVQGSSRSAADLQPSPRMLTAPGQSLNMTLRSRSERRPSPKRVAEEAATPTPATPRVQSARHCSHNMERAASKLKAKAPKLKHEAASPHRKQSRRQVSMSDGGDDSDEDERSVSEGVNGNSTSRALAAGSKSLPELDLDALRDGGYLDMPIADAAKALGVGLSTLKNLAHEKGIHRWPYRSRQSLRVIIEQTTQYMNDNKLGVGEAEQRDQLLSALNAELRDVGTSQMPSLSSTIKRYRQCIFKLNHINKKEPGTHSGIPKTILNAMAALKRPPSPTL